MILHKLPLALLAASLLAGCGSHDEAGDKQPAARVMQAEVEVASLVKTPAHHPTPATLVAENQVRVASRLMGYIRSIDVVEGQQVRAGQKLFSVDPVDVQGQVEQTRAGVKQAEDALADARVEYQRFEALFKEDAVTRQQFEKMKLQHDMAQSRLAQARAGHNTAAGQLRYATVTSPIAGVVTQKLAHAGDLAAPGHPVLVVENPGRLQVETQVPESVLSALKPGAQVLVEVDGQEKPLLARVARISPAADPVSRTFLVKLDIGNPPHPQPLSRPREKGASSGAEAPVLRSGLFARVLFPQGEREALTVPAGALVNRAGITGVFVVGQDGIAQFRMVRAGESRDGRLEILSGLSDGERVVSGGAEKLESGDKVGH
ncbi:MAG: efflux RND transporter periplasmic adaptor subunit [Pseudomonadota bacterium]|nr:efflux RND transporter periplasmic adaptor subunit [Pseudomonadota bacterium]